MAQPGRVGALYWGVVLDAPDPMELAQFWSDLLGWPIRSQSPTWVTLKPDEGVAYLGVHAAPEYVPPVWPPRAGQQQQMLHIDVETDDLAAAVEHAVTCGARLAEVQPQQDVRVMLDPVGHPFCLYLGS